MKRIIDCKMWNVPVRCIALCACVLLAVSCGNSAEDESKNVKPAEDADKLTEYGTPSVTFESFGTDSGVMLQAFTWESHKQGGTWWNTIEQQAESIKQSFEYVWLAPCTDSLSENGYLPRELNVFDSKYGTESDLRAALNALAPAKPIADIVINHRVGTTSWGDFTNPDWDVVKGSDYRAICSDDEGYENELSVMGAVPPSMRGAKDTGDGYNSGRDIDHTNTTVQQGIVTWMKSLKDMGFAGWRYDYVRGFDGKYVGYYNAETDAAFSVGELWPDNYSVSGWTQKFEAWVNATSQELNGTVGKASRVFDFTLKGVFNEVFGRSSGAKNSNYGKLADENIFFRKQPNSAVTFVENHDTASTQKHWPQDKNDLGTAYAFILTHPGVPCVSAEHYFTSGTSDCISGKTVPGTTMTYKNHIDYLIALRNQCGIQSDSKLEVLKAESSLYAAKIIGDTASVVVAVGEDPASYSAPEGFSPLYSGTNWQIWK